MKKSRFTEAQIAHILAQAASHFPEMDPFDGGLRMLLEALLQSPHFVYRVEIGQSQNGDTVQLSDFEIASRMSYTIWNTMPDDALLHAAEREALHTPEQIGAQAARLLDDPRGQAMLERFHGQLLNWELYLNTSKDAVGVSAPLRRRRRRYVRIGAPLR